MTHTTARTIHHAILRGKAYTIAIAIAALLAMAIAPCARAQDQPEHRFTGNFGGGYSPLLGDLHNDLNNGWHVSFGGGVNLTNRFSLGGEVMYNAFGVSQRVLNEAAVPAADAHLWAFTLEPRLDFAPERRVSAYLVGGVGYYRRVLEFTQPTVAAVTIFDPFFGFFNVLVPANQVLGTIVRGGVGGNAGFGLEFRVGDMGTKLFVESRFHYAETGDVPTRIIPITIGIRF
ncbi:MAG TPA: outer membrane beta-barrel protein [Candidatus Acidoferrales bacterium]|nr:outer membrane beta-barrel protein [Candidatus Acidoferrales bacterium]